MRQKLNQLFPLQQAVIGDWVLVPFAKKKSFLEFVGLIIETPDEGGYTVKFAKISSVFYVFPEKDHIADVQEAQIVKKRPQPSCNNRCQYAFCA